MDVEERIALVKRNAMEVVNEDELRELLKTKEHPLAYIGFEPSGLVHLGWALVASKIRDLCDAGFQVIVFWADWHASINDKLGGDLENIRACARYMEDCFVALGVERDKVQFRYATELISDPTYWEKLIKVGKVTSLNRIKRAMTIMGRKEDEAELDSSKVVYPLMQATDMFHMGIDLAYAGIDQRRAHMLVRDAADKLGWAKPVAVHTPLIPGLKANGGRMNPDEVQKEGIEAQSQEMIDNKMSKSDPSTSLRVHDTPDEIRQKIKKAYCPPEKEFEKLNPILSMSKYIIFPKFGKMDIKRPEKYGGDVSYDSYEALCEDYFGGKLSPVDLKGGFADSLIAYLAPVAEYFEKHPENYERMKEIVASVKKLR